jgi:hypothetical protein
MVIMCGAKPPIFYSALKKPETATQTISKTNKTATAAVLVSAGTALAACAGEA